MTAPITNPFLGWHRCDECGAEADAPCCDMDDQPVTTTCKGRMRKETEPCRYCGAPRRSLRRACRLPACSKTECQRAADSEWHRIKRAAKPKRKEPECCWCGVALPVKGRRKTVKRPCCGAVECAKARKRMWEAENRRKALTPSTDTL